MAEQVEETFIVPRHRFGMELERERRIDVALNRLNHAIRRTGHNAEPRRNDARSRAVEAVDHDLLFSQYRIEARRAVNRDFMMGFLWDITGS